MTKLPELTPGMAVRIEWADSKALLGWTYNPNLQRKPGYIQSLGFVVQMNKECLTLTTSMDGKGSSIDDFSIPLGCITKLLILPSKFGVVSEEAAKLAEFKRITAIINAKAREAKKKKEN